MSPPRGRWPTLLLVALAGLAGCLPAFPDPPTVTVEPTDAAPADGRVAADRGPALDQGPADAAPPLGDTSPPPLDARVGDQDPSGCPAIELGASVLRLRAWDGRGGLARLRAGGGCGPLRVLGAPPWLEARLEVDSLVVEVAAGAPAGRTEATVTVEDAEGQTARLPVVLEHFARAIGRRPRALVVLVGGLGDQPLTPVLAWLAGQGLSERAAALPPEAEDRPAAGWATALTGVEPAVHGVREAPTRAARPSFPGRVRAASQAVSVGSQWAPLADVVEADLGVITGDFDGAVAHVTARLADSDRTLFVLAANGPAAAGRDEAAAGAALQAVDAAVDRLLSAVVARERFADEDWLVVVAGVPSDGAVLPLIFARPGWAPEPLGPKASLLDIAPTVLRHLGLVIQPGWQLPGRLVGGGTEADCRNERDDDGDGRIDCRDEDCDAECDFQCLTHDAGYAEGRLAAADVEDLQLDQAGSCGGRDTPGLAVRWTAPRDDRYLIHTDGSELESVVYVYPRDCRGGELGCGEVLYGTDDLDEPGAVLLDAQAGESFILFADSDFFRLSGRVQVEVYGRRAECEGARDLGEQVGRLVQADNRAAPTRLPPNLGGALCNPDDPPPCAYDTLFRWRAPRAGRWRFSTEGSDFDTVLRIFGGTCAALEPLACHDDVNTDAALLYSQVDAQLAAGQEVLVVVSGYWRSGRNDDRDRGNFTLSVGPAQ